MMSASASPSLPAAAGRSVIWHLVVFAAAIVLPIVSFVALLMWQTTRQEQARIEERVVEVARSIVADLDQDFSEIKAKLAWLGRSSALHPERVEELAHHAEAVAAMDAIGVTVRGEDGSAFVRRGPLQANDQGPEWLECWHVVKASREPVVSGIVPGLGERPHAYLVMVPITQDGAVRWVIEAALPPDRALSTLRKGLPGDVWAASYMDRSGRLVTRTRNPDGSIGVAATEQFRRAAVTEHGTWIGPSHEGNALLGGFARSRASGWYVAVGVERDQLSAPLYRTIKLGLIALSAATLLSVALAVLFGQRIAKPILGLAALSSGRRDRAAPPVARSSLSEVNTVAAALEATTRQLEERNAALAESEAHFRSFVELNPQLPWIADAQGHLIDISERWSRFTGVSLEETLDGGWMDVQHPDDLQPMISAWNHALANGEPLDIEHRMRRREGHFRWMRSRAYPRRDDSGRIIRWYGTTEDIDERRRAREALQASQEQLQVGLAVAGIGLADLDYITDEVRLDDRAAEIFDLPAKVSLPRPRLHARIHRDDAPELFRQMKTLFGDEGESFLSAEYRVVTESGAVRWLNARHKVDYVIDAAGRRKPLRGLLAVQDITRRKQSEQRLAESYAQIRAIYDNAPIGLCILGTDMRFRRINGRLAEFNGVPAEEHVGREVREIVPDLVEQVQGLVSRIVETRAPIINVELVGETPAAPGERRIWNESWQPLFDEAGEVYAISIVAEEITQRRRDEAALAAAADQLRTIAEAVPGLMWVTDETGANTFVNRGFCDYVGRPPEGLLGHKWMDVIHPDDMAANMSLWRDATLSGSAFVSQYRFRCHDGSWRWHLTRTVPQRDREGRMVQWVGMATDIDELLRARMELEASRTELEHRVAAATAERNEIWRLTPDLLGVSDISGRWRSVNPAWKTVLGFDLDEITQMPPHRLVHPEDRNVASRMRQRLADGEMINNVEYRCRRKGGGYRWLSWTAVAREGLIYAAARDVTDQKAAEAQLREAQETLHQAQKTETIGQLTGGVAHDFNNLLAAILSNLELARKSAHLDRRTGKLIAGAIEGVERGASLTARLLAFARRQELKAQPVDVAALIAGMRDLLVRSLGPTIVIRHRVDADLPSALVDPHQLELALLNLAVNARDAMPSGGELAITVTRETLPPRNREQLPRGDYISIALSDTGTGMDKATLERATEPFFTTKGVGKGTGLGLPMVQGLIAQSGGAMRLESRVGAGTTVTLLLPTTQERIARKAASADAPAVDRGQPARKLTVMVVDDDPLVAMGTVAMLEDLGHQIVEARSGTEALQLIESGTAVDVVLTDHAMPGMTGVELAQALATRKPDLPVVLATGYADLKPEQLPADLPRLGKPYRQGDLARILSDVALG